LTTLINSRLKKKYIFSDKTRNEIEGNEWKEIEGNEMTGHERNGTERK